MTGSGTSEDPYVISDVDDLQAMEDNLASYYELGGNIDASATSDWNDSAGFDPILLFTGQLDGKGYTISDLFINRPTESYVGLIGDTDASIVLKNIKMTGVDITGNASVGALLGNDIGGGTPDIDDCSSAGSVTASNGQVGGLIGYLKGGTVDSCWSSCTVVNGSSGDQAGGLIGYLGSATITSCYATGSVTSDDDDVGGLIGDLLDATITKCYATGNVVGAKHYVGGFVGRISQDPSITNCYARGNATATGSYAGGFTGNNHTGLIDDCYSTGVATGESPVGGFCSDDYGTITNCFWDTETSSNATSDGGTGKTTAEMKTKATFTAAGWDFTTPIWYIGANNYPVLSAVDVTSIYPSDAVARVSSIRHVAQPGSCRMQVGLGDLGFDVDVAEATVRSALDTAKEVVEEPAEPSVTKPPAPAAVPPTDVVPPEPGQLTEYAKKIMERPAAKALEARIAGLKAGVEAVVTPYAIDVLREKEAQAKKLIELQRIQKSAATPGITSYARQVLIKRAIQLKQELEAMYKGGGGGSRFDLGGT